MASQYWRWFLDLAWLIFLIMMLRHFWRIRRELSQVDDWLKTEGHIIKCEWIAEGGVLWPKIEYIYQVSDKEIIGEYLFLDTAHNTPTSRYSRQVAYDVAMAFKEGRPVDVYYNPNDPKQSALNISIPRKLNVILGLLLIAVLAQLGLIGFRLIQI